MTLLLEPILIRTATEKGTLAGSVRIVWVTSLLMHGTPPGGMYFQPDGTPVVLKSMENYMQSKVGDALLADKFAKRLGEHEILSVVSWGHRNNEFVLMIDPESSPRIHENRTAAELATPSSVNHCMLIPPLYIRRDIC
jgi:hypothetical protein